MCSLDVTFTAISQTTVRGKPVLPHQQASSTQNTAYAAAAWTIDETFGKPQASDNDQVGVTYAASTSSANTWDT